MKCPIFSKSKLFMTVPDDIDIKQIGNQCLTLDHLAT